MRLSSWLYFYYRLPSALLDMDSPHFRFHEQQLDYSSLKVFGCRCYPYEIILRICLRRSHIHMYLLATVPSTWNTIISILPPNEWMKLFFLLVIHPCFMFPHRYTGISSLPKMLSIKVNKFRVIYHLIHL